MNIVTLHVGHPQLYPKAKELLLKDFGIKEENIYTEPYVYVGEKKRNNWIAKVDLCGIRDESILQKLPNETLVIDVDKAKKLTKKPLVIIQCEWSRKGEKGYPELEKLREIAEVHYILAGDALKDEGKIKEHYGKKGLDIKIHYP